MLTDPLTSAPAIVVSATKIKSLLPNYVLLRSDGTLTFSDPSPFSEKLRLLPYCTIGSPHGIMHGFTPDFVKTDGNALSNVVIAIAPYPLTSNGEYDAVFNPALLSEPQNPVQTPASENV